MLPTLLWEQLCLKLEIFKCSKSPKSQACVSCFWGRGQRNRKLCLQLNYFQIAAVTNYHKLSDVSQTQISSFTVLGGRKSEISFTALKSRCQHCWVLLEVLEEDLFPCLSQGNSWSMFLGLWSLPTSSKHMTPISASFEVNKVAW